MIMSTMIHDSWENIRLWKKKVPMDEKSFWSIIAWSSCCSKLQDTFFCCLRHPGPELQFSRINGWWNGEKTTQAYFTRGAHKCEKCHLPSTIFPYLGVQVTSTFHALHCWVQNGSMTNFRITWRAPPHAIWDCILCHRSLNMLTECMSQWVAVHAAGPVLVVLINSTVYGADWRTQDSEQNCSRNQDFLNFCLVGPNVGPAAELEVSSLLTHNLLIMIN